MGQLGDASSQEEPEGEEREVKGRRLSLSKKQRVEGFWALAVGSSHEAGYQIVVRAQGKRKVVLPGCVKPRRHVLR